MKDEYGLEIYNDKERPITSATYQLFRSIMQAKRELDNLVQIHKINSAYELMAIMDKYFYKNEMWVDSPTCSASKWIPRE